MKVYQNKKRFYVISLNVKITQTLQWSGSTTWMHNISISMFFSTLFWWKSILLLADPKSNLLPFNSPHGKDRVSDAKIPFSHLGNLLWTFILFVKLSFLRWQAVDFRNFTGNQFLQFYNSNCNVYIWTKHFMRSSKHILQFEITVHHQTFLAIKHNMILSQQGRYWSVKTPPDSGKWKKKKNFTLEHTSYLRPGETHCNRPAAGRNTLSESC